MIKTTRNGAGSYTVADPAVDLPGLDATVSVVRIDEIPGPAKWIARAGWDRFCYTDPLFTKADAVEQAAGMLADLTR